MVEKKLLNVFAMEQNRISILSTRPLNEEWIEDAAALNIGIDINVFIETEPIQSVEVLEEIGNALLQSTTVVFTSVNAVNAVGENLELQQPDWRIYCIGHATKQQLVKYFGDDSIAGTADNAEALAEVIIEDEIDDLIFFCGKQRREEMPQILREHGVEVNEIVVYETISTPHKLDKHYNGVMFFSPSAVESFFQNNKPDHDTLLFAIGKTTASAIKKFSDNKVIVSEEPSKEGMFQELKEYYDR